MAYLYKIHLFYLQAHTTMLRMHSYDNLIDFYTTLNYIIQMYLHQLMMVCRWCQWMQQARSEPLGADQHWDLVKWSLVTLCSTGEGEPPLTTLAQCLVLVQPHTLSPTSILVQCMKWELHQWALLDWVKTGVRVGSKLRFTPVSVQCKCAN